MTPFFGMKVDLDHVLNEFRDNPGLSISHVRHPRLFISVLRLAHFASNKSFRLARPYLSFYWSLTNQSLEKKLNTKNLKVLLQSFLPPNTCRSPRWTCSLYFKQVLGLRVCHKICIGLKINIKVTFVKNGKIPFSAYYQK